MDSSDKCVCCGRGCVTESAGGICAREGTTLSAIFNCRLHFSVKQRNMRERRSGVGIHGSITAREGGLCYVGLSPRSLLRAGNPNYRKITTHTARDETRGRRTSINWLSSDTFHGQWRSFTSDSFKCQKCWEKNILILSPCPESNFTIIKR